MVMAAFCRRIVLWYLVHNMTTEYTRPLPRPDAHTKPFWDSCAHGDLTYQCCADCGCVQRIPRALCEQCHSQSLTWKPSAGVGTVLSFTTVHRAPLPAFKALVPYTIAIIDMDEGFRVMANATTDAAGALAINARVKMGMIDVDGTMLPIVQAVIQPETKP